MPQFTDNLSQPGDSANSKTKYAHGMKLTLNSITIGLNALFATANLALADGSSTNALDTRYGWFNSLDHRSSYGQFFFPEPFLIDDSDLETRELRLDWLHTAVGGSHTDNAKAELEYGLGLTTLELEVPYERDVADGTTVSGPGNISIGARRPLYQFVSDNEQFDTTFGAAIELGIPTKSNLSHNTELVPKIFDDTRFGNLTVQSVLGYSLLFGPGGEGGIHTFEYGFVFGYVIPHETLSFSGVERLIPVAELKGETQVNKADAGHNSLLADVGLRVNLKSFHGIQARPGIVFVFPLDKGARTDTHWGILTSLVFEF
jgi:hypothetical protein